MTEQSGRLFDPVIVDALFECRAQVEEIMTQEQNMSSDGVEYSA
jgi:response regulator RpfG family c-di-GMP phosphodiesterase